MEESAEKDRSRGKKKLASINGRGVIRMKRYRWQILLGLALILSSGILYSIHYAIFKDAHHIYIYLLGDIAFLPVEVLLVSIIIHQLLSQREKKAILEKLNMVIGSFFSEVGTRLITYFSDFDPKLSTIRDHLIVRDDWSEQEFSKVSKYLRNYDYNVDIRKVDLEGLRTFLLGRREFMLLLLENPTLLEHEPFSGLLRAVFHLTEELEKREDVKQLPETDYAHLAGDIKRAYTLLVQRWLSYVRYLKDNYPYLFSLVMRTNPFDQAASPFVK
jgi:hypothetical protein